MPGPEARKFIVVPEGLQAGPDGRGNTEPSFVYRQVLETTLALARAGDEVYLAPANNFGGPIPEEEAARRYLEKRGAPFRTFYPGHNLPANAVRPRYIDTLDNARLLRAALGSTAGEYELICSYLHAPRAIWCFQRTGFRFKAIHRVVYRMEPDPVPPRLSYYRWKPLHRAYEFAALLRDVTTVTLRWR